MSRSCWPTASLFEAGPSLVFVGEVERIVHRRAGWVSSMLSAVKLCQSSSSLRPFATAKPRSAKISAQLVHHLADRMHRTFRRSLRGSVRSIVSRASRASSSAASSAAFFASIASAIAGGARSGLRGAAGVAFVRVHALSVLRERLTQHFLPGAASRCSSSASRLAASAIAASAACVWESISVMACRIGMAECGGAASASGKSRLLQSAVA